MVDRERQETEELMFLVMVFSSRHAQIEGAMMERSSNISLILCYFWLFKVLCTNECT